MDARDFKVERQRAKQLEDRLHKRRATRPALLRAGEMHADEEFRAGGRRYETLAVCGLVRGEIDGGGLPVEPDQHTGVDDQSHSTASGRILASPRSMSRANSSASRGPKRGSERTSSSS